MSLLDDKARPSIFKKPIPTAVLKEYMDVLSKNQVLFVLFLHQGQSPLVFIEQDQEDSHPSAKIFWKLDEAQRYKKYIEYTRALPKDSVLKIWKGDQTTLLEIATKINRELNRRKNDPEIKGKLPPNSSFTFEAATYLEKELRIVDIFWTDNKDLMV